MLLVHAGGDRTGRKGSYGKPIFRARLRTYDIGMPHSSPTVAEKLLQACAEPQLSEASTRPNNRNLSDLEHSRAAHDPLPIESDKDAETRATNSTNYAPRLGKKKKKIVYEAPPIEYEARR